MSIKCAQFNHPPGLLPVFLLVNKKPFDNIRVTGHIPRPLIIPVIQNLGVKVLANIKSAKKRALLSEKSRKHNASRRTMMRTFIKKVVVAIEAANKELATAEFVKLQSVLDAYATKGLISKNMAARKKSRLSAKIKAL